MRIDDIFKILQAAWIAQLVACLDLLSGVRRSDSRVRLLSQVVSYW